MKNQLTERNKEIDFKIPFPPKESRLKKCISIVNKIKTGKMLDIGCASGEWSEYWKNKGWDVYGVDVNEAAVSLAQKKGVNASVCDIAQNSPLPYDDNSMDFIFAGEVIEHIVDTDRFISELYRVLKVGGSAIITTPNLVSFENRLRIFFGLYPEWVDYSLSKGVGHVRAYTPRVLKTQMIESNFIIKKHLGNWVPFVPQFLLNDQQMPILSLTGDWLPNLSMGIILFVEKGK
jgi:2-polyprenyl-3-methyl-5-hydroxy-6-metoxy-1,4-benzoquinol methylase